MCGLGILNKARQKTHVDQYSVTWTRNHVECKACGRDVPNNLPRGEGTDPLVCCLVAGRGSGSHHRLYSALSQIWDEKGGRIKKGVAEIAERDQDHVPEVKVLIGTRYTFWKYVLAVAALAVSLSMAIHTETNPRMQQHRTVGALNRGTSGLSKKNFRAHFG